jgi:hypothetical protein
METKTRRNQTRNNDEQKNAMDREYFGGRCREREKERNRKAPS